MNRRESTYNILLYANLCSRILYNLFKLSWTEENGPGHTCNEKETVTRRKLKHVCAISVNVALISQFGIYIVNLSLGTNGRWKFRSVLRFKYSEFWLPVCTCVNQILLILSDLIAELTCTRQSIQFKRQFWTIEAPKTFRLSPILLLQKRVFLRSCYIYHTLTFLVLNIVLTS